MQLHAYLAFVLATSIMIAGKASGFLHSQRAFQSVLRTAGGLMIIAGISLAVARRVN